MKNTSIIKSLMSNKAVVYFTMLMIFAFGLNAYQTIPKQEYPDTTMPGCYIKIVYPGATPKELEDQVIKPIEEELIEMEDYFYEKSMIYDSMGLILFVVEPSLSEDAIEDRWMDLDKIIDKIKPTLPSGVSDIIIDTDLMAMPHVIYALSGERYNTEQLIHYSEALKGLIKAQEGIEKVELSGDEDKEVLIKVEVEKLAHYGLTLSELKGLLMGQDMIMPLGTMDTGASIVKVRSNSGIHSIEALEKMIIKRQGQGGQVITLDRVARINFDEDPTFIAKVNGVESILIAAYYKDDSNIIDGGQRLRQVVGDFQNQLPQGLNIDEVTFVSENVEESINEFVWSLIQGMVIVLIVICLGMGIRNSLMVSLAIPLAVMVTFVVMNLLGMKFHLLSLAALILVLGMLVDNSIVVSDAIQGKIDSGEDKLEACVDGVREVAIPVLSSTLTTIAAFSPLLMLPAAMGAFIGSIPRIVIMALTASYVIAMLVIPVLAFTFFKPSVRKEKTQRIKGLFKYLLNHGLRHRMITMTIAVVLLVAVMILSGFLEKSSYPTEDRPFLYVNVETEFPTDLRRSEKIIDNIQAYLLEQEEVHHCFSTVGGDFPRFHMSVTYRGSGKNMGQLILQFDLNRSNRFESNGAFVDYLQYGLNEKIIGAKVEVKEFEMTGDGSPIQVRLLAEDMEHLRAVGQELTDMLYNVEGTKNVVNDIDGKEYTYEFNISEDMAVGHGMTSLNLQNEMNLALLGQEVATLHMNNEDYPIRLIGDVTSDEELRHIPIRSQVTKGITPLKVYGTMTLRDQITRFVRYDNMPSVTISASPLNGYNSIAIQTQLEDRFKEMGYKDIRLVSEGEKGKLERGTGDMRMAGLLAVFLVYSILILQFKSIIQPVIIVLTIPLSFIGAMAALLILKQTLSLFAILGFLSLFGVVVNNGIILIDCINRELAKGLHVYDACKKAVDIRVRPVMLSTTTTVFGLLPLTISGGDLFRPMAIAFMGGLMISTFLTLIIIPVIFSSVHIWQRRIIKFIIKISAKHLENTPKTV